MEAIEKGAGARSIASKLLNVHIQKELKLSIGFNNKDLVHDLSESRFQAAKHMHQSPWVREGHGRKQRCFSWPVLLPTGPSKAGCSVHDPVAPK